MSVFESISALGHEQIIFCHDDTVGLKAIIAVHNTTLGPALGGCRFWNYSSEQEALNDVLRLSKGMTYKAAITGLQLGGGKAVIIGDPTELKSEAFFRTFGRFVHSLAGRYITAEDVNVRVADMEYVALETPYVTGIHSRQGSGDPSPITALGVFSGIRAAVKYQLKRDSLSGLKIAVQGCGAVGYNLCSLLHNEGAKLVVADIDDAKVDLCVSQFKADVANVNEILTCQAEVFAPCALGAVLNDKSIDQLNVPIVAGGANNQLENEESHGRKLQQRNILYAPDYVINAGGLINVFHELRGYNEAAARKQTSGIYDTLLNIFTLADNEKIPTQDASNRIADARINSVKQMSNLRNSLSEQRWHL